MAKRSRIPELREKSELSCMWGLFTILESCQGRVGPKLISNGRRVNEHIVDYPRKLDQLASFDEECRKIQNGELASVKVEASARSWENHKTKQNIVKTQQHANMDSELVDNLMKTHKRARKNSQKAYQPANLIDKMPSTSAEISLSKLTLDAMLGAVGAQNHREESRLSEYFEKSILLGKCDAVDEFNMRQVQMRAKAIVDQMFIDRKFISKRGTRSESKSFSDALEALNSNKDIFIENFHRFQMEKEFAGISERQGSTLATQTGKLYKNLWKSTSQPETSFVARPSNKIVILKPAPLNAKHSGSINCHCSSLQFQKQLSRRVSDAKPRSFSFREMKKKLKHTFGSSDKLSQESSTLRVGDGCTCRGVEIRNSLDSSTNAKTNEKPCKKHDPKSNTGSDDIVCVTETVRKKLDFSTFVFSKKQEFDLILEAKRHLSTRWEDLNVVETEASQNSPKTLGRILSSPELDSWPLSPRRESRYSSVSPEMRYSPFNTTPRMPNGRERGCLSPLRPNTEVISHDDYNKCDGILQTMDSKTSSLIPSADDEVYDSDISATDHMKSTGESKIEELNSILPPELQTSDVPNETNITNVMRTMHITDTIVLQKDDESVMHSTLDSLSENEALTSIVDDFPSTPSSIHQLDLADTIKYQEEHRSPVSVLEPFFTDDANSPPSTALRTAGQRLQPLRLDFKECSLKPLHQDPPISAISCIDERDYLSQYVHLVLQASYLNWDLLSETRSLPEELLHESFFDEVEFMPTYCYFDPKLLFDHINEVLLELYRSHFCSPPWLAFVRPKIRSAPLGEVVLDEIMKEADFYLLPRTERRTLDQLVLKDVAACRSWLDVRFDIEQIVIDTSEDILEECILDILFEFHK